MSLTNNSTKIGLVTYYKENYGSVLQCYATKHFVESMGYKCDVLYQVNGSILGRFKRLFNMARHAWRAVRYRGYFSHYMLMHNAMSQEKGYITKTALSKIDGFISDVLQPKGYNWKQLCDLNKRQNYQAFIAGSDQIWNASITIEPIFFLLFADKNKRIAFAPSFGVAEIPNFNIGSIKKGLSGFNRISVREETGERIVKQYSAAIPVRVADPTILLSKEEWQSFSSAAKIPEEPYIFVHFLNKPNKVAVEAVNLLAKTKKCNVLCFSYRYEEYETIHFRIYCDGDPGDFVGLIRGAEAVCTDSFHSTLFSMIFGKEFYTFHRQYLHGCPQTSRIVDLLKRYGAEERLISSMEEMHEVYKKEVPNVEAILYQERIKTTAFLWDEIHARSFNVY